MVKGEHAQRGVVEIAGGAAEVAEALRVDVARRCGDLYALWRQRSRPGIALQHRFAPSTDRIADAPAEHRPDDLLFYQMWNRFQGHGRLDDADVAPGVDH